MTFILKFIIVFIVVTLSDMAWAKYMLYVAEKKAMPSAIWGTLIMVGSMVSVISYTQDSRLIPAALLGAFIGTYLTVKRSAK